MSSPATPEALRQQLSELTVQLAGRNVDHELQLWLNAQHGPGSPIYEGIRQSCEGGVAAGWLCNREAEGIRYGRIFRPDAALHGFSVDVVDMNEIAGPHHVHPEGEIDMVMPMERDARFDGHPAGWLVCPPGSAHRPTVTGGRALVLYLLPNGAIQFTR